MENSAIEWTDHTFNPWMGCTKVSPACEHCYAERDTKRWGRVHWGAHGNRVITADANWRKPLKWNKKGGRVFCASLSDVFEDWPYPMYDHPHVTMADVRLRLFELIDATPNLIWMLLTKRPENIARMWHGGHRKNVWLGTSTENQQYADERIPRLMAVKYKLADTLFISAEPLLGPIVLHGALHTARYIRSRAYLQRTGIDWVIAGGESGPKARPSDIAWFRSLRDQCVANGVPFHFKQWGEHDQDGKRVGKKTAGRLLDGKKHSEVPLCT